MSSVDALRIAVLRSVIFIFVLYQWMKSSLVVIKSVEGETRWTKYITKIVEVGKI